MDLLLPKFFKNVFQVTEQVALREGEKQLEKKR